MPPRLLTKATKHFFLPKPLVPFRSSSTWLQAALSTVGHWLPAENALLLASDTPFSWLPSSFYDCSFSVSKGWQSRAQASPLLTLFSPPGNVIHSYGLKCWLSLWDSKTYISIPALSFWLQLCSQVPALEFYLDVSQGLKKLNAYHPPLLFLQCSPSYKWHVSLPNFCS